MESWLAIIIIVLGTLLNEVPLLVGIIRAKQDMVFLGVISHAQDYFYYLSQFAMGKNHWFFGFDPLTTEVHDLTLVGWPNIFLGKLFSIIGISHIYAYQISVALFTFFFLLLCYQLITKLVATRLLRLFMLFLFVFTNNLPLISRDRLGFHVAFKDFWFNLGNPLTRLGGVPHQLLANCAILIIFLGTIRYYKQHTKSSLVYLALAGFILASINPVQWMVVGIVVVTHAFFSQKRQLLLPAILIIVSGLPIAIYLKELFAGLPYSQLVIWETAQHVSLGVKDLLSTYGVTGIFAVIGLVLIAKNKNFENRLVFLYGIISFALFYSPLPQLLRLTNARFISSVSVLVLVYSAVIAVKIIIDRLHHKKIAYAVLSTIIIVLFIPVFYLEVKDSTSYFQLNNAYFYLPKTVLSVFAKARDISSENDAFLVMWPYNNSFAGLTGRREFNGHPLMTIDAKRKDDIAWQFFSGTVSQQDMQKLLQENHITYVIAYPSTFSPSLYFLQTVYSNQALSLYRVENIY